MRVWMTFLGVVGLALLASPAHGQEFGIKGGVTRSTLFPPVEEWTTAGGFQVGGFYEVPLTGWLALRPEVSIARRSSRVEDGAGALRIVSATRLDYLEVPLLVVGTFRRGARLQPQLFGGPFAAARLSARIRTEAGGSAFDEDLRAETRPRDAGYVVGGGLRVRQGRATWIVDMRYTGGLQRVDSGWVPDAAKNRSVSVLAGRAF